MVAQEGELALGIAKNDPEWQFFDTAKIHVQGGDGGDGCVAFRREKGIAMGGPNGGTGGRGGSIYLRCDKNLNTLATVRHKVHYKATKGQTGQGKGRHGSSGGDLYIVAPAGTIVRDMEGNFCGELSEHGQELLIAKGGRGGRGNEAFKTSRNTAPKFADKGEPAARRWLNLELKLVADVGFVGVPNAGKSTLLAVCSNAKPKIANYPFTTVTPNLGVCDVIDGDEGGGAAGAGGHGLVLADIPGLLEGAHAGVGLGLAFLRHIQRCRILVHVVNGDSPDPVGDYQAIQQEMELFNPRLLEKPQVVVLNKIDLPHVKERQEEVEQALREVVGHGRVMPISAVARTRTQELMRRLLNLLASMPTSTDDLFAGERYVSLDSEMEENQGFQLISDPAYPGQWRVAGARIERVAKMTNWDYYEAVQRFQRVLQAMGISDALKRAGAEEGDLVMVDEYDFDYSPEAHSVYYNADDDDGDEY